MPGALDNNLRRAYVQEQLGIYLLRAVAAVAEVERPQDVGIDAIATLLRPETKRRLVANLSFYVQLKTASVTDVIYEGDEVTWLKQLLLPLFIGRVDPGSLKLSLYTTHRAMYALNIWDYTHLSLHLDESPTGGGASEDWKTEEALDDKGLQRSAVVWLGHPVIELTSGDLADHNLLTNFCDVMRPTIEILNINIKWRPIKYTEQFSWKTGNVPTVGGFSVSSQALEQLEDMRFTNTEEFHRQLYLRGLPVILEEISPYVRAWALHAIANEQPDAWEYVRSMLKVLEKNGIEQPHLKKIQALAQKTFEKHG